MELKPLYDEVTGKEVLKNPLDRKTISKYELDSILNCEDTNANEFL